MSKHAHVQAPSLDLSATIAAAPDRVQRAFFEPAALRAWWQVVNAVATPRVLGPFALEWAASDYRDDILGRLGGVFRGIVMQFDPGRSFFVADAFWLPPDGDPIGPMALEVSCTPVDLHGVMGTAVHVTQTGFEEGVRWRRYYEVIGVGWERALASLKALLEK